MTRQRKEEQRKREIRAAATRCFVKNGYESTRLLDIAKEAGLSKGGVYFHYRAKDQLFHDILENHLQRLRDRWAFVPASDRPADRTLGRLVVAHLKTLEDEPNETRLFNLLVSMSTQDEAFRGKLERAMLTLTSLYRDVIERGIRDGIFAAVDARHAASSVLAMIHGLGFQTALDVEGCLPVPPEIVADQVLRSLKISNATTLEFGAVDKSSAPN